MAERLAGLWRPTGDEFGPRRERRPCAYEAYVPDRLQDLTLELPVEVAADISEAERALALADRPSGLPQPEPTTLESLARFLLRAEAVASSRIEGLVVTGRRLARHEARVAAGVADIDPTADEVLGNVRALLTAVDRVAAVPVIGVEDLLAIHADLFEASPHQDIAGRIRRTQNWIGGNAFNPCAAAFVPPPPDRVVPLLKDLCGFLNDDRTSPLVQAALVHAAFETIHPFADGNGRVGRALIHVILVRRKLCRHYVPPISLALAAEADRYIRGLTAYRYDGPPGSPQAQEGITRWIEIFTVAARRAATDTTRLSERLTALETGWRERVRPRRGSAADRLLPLLASRPVLSAQDVARLVAVSAPAAQAAVRQLVDAGVLVQAAGGERNRLWEAEGVLDVVNDYERAAVTPGADTRVQQPARPAPRRSPR